MISCILELLLAAYLGSATEFQQQTVCFLFCLVMENIVVDDFIITYSIPC